ncbi:helix-turn-helix transcriptional regulator [Paraburkholderia sp. BCC1885]|uniref:helix-turn-helix transcriptional regulator n=1 Tax=Paraburkholderia sp. BCC1885 TaxID=2562669 RepID=UPI0011837BFD|nr:AraC family transcriptional regulator [Paraburkholderia sp. BCC1885]
MKSYPTKSTHVPADRVSTVRRVSISDYSTRMHEHEEYMFLLPRVGLLMLDIETHGRSIRIAPWSFTAIPPNRMHQTHAGHGAQEHIAVYVESDFVTFCEKKARRRMVTDRVTVSPAPGSLLSAVRLRYLERANPDGDLASYRVDLLDRVVATACIEATLREQEGRRPRADVRRNLVADIKEFLDATLSERIDIDRVACEFGVSRRHLTRIFRDTVGESIVEYRSRQRVLRAASLLELPGMTVIGAATAVGIDSPSYLARLFDKYGKPLPGTFKR